MLSMSQEKIRFPGFDEDLGFGESQRFEQIALLGPKKRVIPTSIIALFLEKGVFIPWETDCKCFLFWLEENTKEVPF